MRKIISTLLSVALVLTMFSFSHTAYANTKINVNTSDTHHYTLDDNSMRYEIVPNKTGWYEFKLFSSNSQALKSDLYAEMHLITTGGYNSEVYDKWATYDENTGCYSFQAYLKAGLTHYVATYIALNYDTLLELDATFSFSDYKHKHELRIASVDLASSTDDGCIYYRCDNQMCNYTKKGETIPKANKITLSATSYVYNGKEKKPSVTVKDRTGKKLKNGTDYSISYSKGRKNVGKYTVTIKFKGNYEDTVKKTFTIKPKPTTLSKVTAGKKAFTVKWKKQATQTTGYQIQYSTDKNFKKNNKTITVSKNKTTSKKVTKLKSKKKYYVRVRTYKTVGKTKYYSSWSKAKTVTTKK